MSAAIDDDASTSATVGGNNKNTTNDDQHHHDSSSFTTTKMISITNILEFNNAGANAFVVDDVDPQQQQRQQQQQQQQQQRQGSKQQQQTSSSNTTIIADERQQYELRLLSFSSHTYKPSVACLSPLLCARFGWENVDNDMLVCSCCKSALTIPLNLRLALSQTYVDAVRTKIVTQHEPTCRYGMTIESFRKYDDVPEEDVNVVDSSLSSIVIPTYMSEVVPVDFLNLVEHPRPSEILKLRTKELLQCLRSHQSTKIKDADADTANAAFPADDASTPTWTYPNLELPNELQQVKVNVRSLLRLTEEDVVPSVNNCDDDLYAVVLALAVLGWTPLDTSNDTQNHPVVSLGCTLCFAFMDLPLKERGGSETDVGDDTTNVGTDEVKDNNDESEVSRRPMKRRQRTPTCCNPLTSHHYYCPFVTGFPKTVQSRSKPVWKTIFERLVHEKQIFGTTSEIDDGHNGNNEKIESSSASPLTIEDAIKVAASDEMMHSIGRIKKILYSGISQTSHTSMWH